MTDAPERPVVPWWLPLLNGVAGSSLCVVLGLRFAEETPTLFSMGLMLIAVALISGGSSAQISSNIVKLGLRLLAPAAKALTEADRTDKDKDK